MTLDPKPDEDAVTATNGGSVHWLGGAGEMARAMKAIDWSKTPLGPIGSWPQSLRTAVSICLDSRHPIVLWWGPQRWMFYNDAYRPFLGEQKHPQFLGRPGWECWAEIWSIIGPMMDQVIETGEATWSEDFFLLLQRSGYLEETYFTFSYSPIRDEAGRPSGIFNACSETTGRILADRRMKMLRLLTVEARTVDSAASRCVEALGRNARDIPFALIYLLDEQGTSLRLAARTGLEAGKPASPSTVAMEETNDQGWPLARVVGSGHAHIVDDLTHRFDGLPTEPWDEPPHQAMLLPIARPGSNRPAGAIVLGISPRRAFDDDYRGFFDLVADQVATAISNARAYEAEKRRAEALAEIDRAKTSFFSNVSHEFRTPLTLILGPTEDALASAGQALSGEALQVVHRNALRLMKLVNSLLDFSRTEAGRARASFAPSDLAAVTASIASSFRSAIERAGLVFAVDCAPLPEPIYIDHDLWEKIVLNLLSNALKFTFAGSIGISIRWRGDHAEMLVQDTGTGIPEHEVPRLFERFHRVHGARSRTHEGSGIGLALVHDLTRLHGGSVHVASRMGEGTAFTVSIPRGSAHLPSDRVVVQASPSWIPQGAASFVQETTGWSGGADRASAGPPAGTTMQRDDSVRILVVDDNADLRTYISGLLSELYVVDTAGDGLAALEAARLSKPTLVVSDVMMPHLDGFGLLRAMRAERPLSNIPVILLSARAGEESTVEGLEAGADDYLAKPFSARELLARVRTHIEIARQRNALIHAKDIAESANRELSSFSYSVAHDLRAPLRSIDGFSSILLEDHGGNLDQDGRRCLDRIRGAAQHMSELIDGLLALARISQSEIHREGVDLSALARAAIARLRSHQPNRRVDVVIQDGLRDEGDPRLLMVAFDNLLGNAWKFTGKRPEARIEFGVTSKADQPAYFVRDNGAGFDMAQANKLFGVFQRLHDDREFEGTGIGLATVQRVVRRHRGHVWAEGAVDHGATFFFTLFEPVQVA